MPCLSSLSQFRHRHPRPLGSTLGGLGLGGQQFDRADREAARVAQVDELGLAVELVLDLRKDRRPALDLGVNEIRIRGRRDVGNVRAVSRPDGLDVSEIATKFGGGGHRGAAGFPMTILDFFMSIKDIEE